MAIANLHERISSALSEFPKIYEEMRLTHEDQVRCARLLTEFAQTSFTAIVGDLSTAERYPSIKEIEEAVAKAMRENSVKISEEDKSELVSRTIEAITKE